MTCEHGFDPAVCVRCQQETTPSGDGSGIDGPLGHPGIAFCICGSAWFRAIVALDQQGTVTAYVSGTEDEPPLHGLVCLECGDAKPAGFKGDHPWQFQEPTP